MSFKPEDHLIDLRGKPYLEVKWRLVWFREDHPLGRIETELVTIEAGLVVMKAMVISGEGVIISTGFGSASAGGNAVWKGREIEKAETACIGRALAHAGYGTQFTGEDESDNVVDSPVDKKSSKSPRNAPPTTQPGTKAEAPAQPQNAPKSRHWIDNDDLRKDFFAWLKQRSISEMEAKAILQVEHFHDFEGHAGNAKTAINKYIKENTRAEVYN